MVVALMLYAYAIGERLSRRNSRDANDGEAANGSDPRPVGGARRRRLGTPSPSGLRASDREVGCRAEQPGVAFSGLSK